MNKQEIITKSPTDITTTAPHPWIEPTFERVALHEALSSFSTPSLDSPYGYS